MVDVEAPPHPNRRSPLDNRSVRRVLWFVGFALGFYWALQWVWPTPSGVVVQGVIIGALTALMSFGIALIYKSNRVINFAQADIGAAPAVFAIMLMIGRTGLTGGQVTREGQWPYWAAILVAIGLAIALGIIIERLVIRRFSRAPRLILMVVTIGLSQILAGLGTAIPFFFGSLLPPQSYPSPFDFTFEIHPIIFRGNDLIAVIAVPVTIAVLMAFLRYTGMGIAIRASAESADRASLLGINVHRTQTVVWVVATLLSTIAMVLRAGILGLPLGSAFGPTILLRALAAAVIGRMENFTVMFLAAAGLGIVETAIIWNKGSGTLVDPVLFLLVIAALLIQRGRKESRVADQATSTWQEAAAVRPVPAELARLPEVRWGLRALGAVLLVALLLLPVYLADGDTNLAAAVFIYAILAVSLVILTGWAGEMSLGQVAFLAIGAAVAGSLTVHYRLDLTLSVLAAAIVGAGASVIIGLPALRIRGLFLAVSTMAFALATSSYLLNRDYFGYLPDNLTERVARLPLLGNLDIASETAFYYVCLVSLGLVVWSVHNLQKSRTARVLIATRENERQAQAFGLNLTRAKLTAFALSGFFASLAGGLFAIHQRAVGQDVFQPAESIRALTMVVVGGLGSLPGALLGAVFVKSTEWFNGVVPRNFRFLFTFAGSGIGLIFVLMILPGGLGSLVYRERDRLLRLVAHRRGLIVPSLIADTKAQPEVLGGPNGDGDTPGLPAEVPWTQTRVRRPGRAPFRWIPQKTAPPLGYLNFPDLLLGGGQASLLSIRSIDVSYGQVQVLFGVSLEVKEGEIIALLGTNGAGKSTLLRAVSGLTVPRGGSIAFDGVDITSMPAHKIASLGVIQVPGGRGIFPSLTVDESLRVAGWMYRRDADHVRRAREQVLDLFPILNEKLDAPAATLSGGQQQMLTLGMAFIARPRLLMIDELSLGLAPVVVEQLLQVVMQLRAAGTTIILVEQSVNVALTVAETAYFMEKGEIRFHGPTAELLNRPDILHSVFLEGAAARGETAEERRRRRPAQPARAVASANGERPAVLRTQDLTKTFSGIRAIDDVSIEIRPSEILGVIGPNGAGKTTLFDLISGFLEPDSGTITFDGRDITGTAPDVRSHLGLARSFQDARVFGALTVSQAIAVALDRQIDARDPIAAALNLPDIVAAERRLAATVEELIEFMGLGAFRDKFISELSTGSRRIVDLSCQLAINPRVILLDEPSSGIAQRETEALGPLLMQIREQTGAALLVIEHDMPLVTAIADRIVALEVGRVIVEGDADTVLNDQRVVASYLGMNVEAIERSGARKPRGKSTRPPASVGGAPVKVLNALARAVAHPVATARRARATQVRLLGTARGTIIWALLGRQRRWVKWFFVLLVTQVVFVGLLPASLVANMVDRAVVAQVVELRPFLGQIIVVAILGMFATFATSQVAARLGYQVEFDLRVWLYTRIQSADLSRLDAVASGQLVTRAMTDLTLVQLVLAAAPGILGLLPIVVGVSIFLFVISPPLAVVAVAAAPVNLWLLAKFRHRLWGLSWAELNERAEVAAAIDEPVRGIRVVQAFGAEERERERLSHVAERAYRFSLTRIRLLARYDILLKLVPYLSRAVLLFVGGRLVAGDDLSLGTFLIAFQASSFITIIATILDQLASTWQYLRTAQSRLGEMLALGSPPVTDKQPLPPPSTGLGLRGVTVELGGRRVLDGLDLVVGPGELVSLAGGPGSGKTTAGLVAAGIIVPDDGTVELDGVDLREVDPVSVRVATKVVSEDPFLFVGSFRDNLELAAQGRADDDALLRAIWLAGADDVVTDLAQGLEAHIGDRGLTLSGGQRQRIGLARALVVPPRLLVLDDALSAVNPALEVEILRRITAHLPQTAVLCISRRPGPARIADRRVQLPDVEVDLDGLAAPADLQPVGPPSVGPADAVLAGVVSDLEITSEQPPAGDRHVARDDVPTIRQVVSPLKALIAVGLVFLFVQTLAGQAPEIMLGAVSDVVEEGSGATDVRALALLGIGVVLAASSYGFRISVGRFTQGAMYVLRRRLFHRLSRLGTDYYDREQPGQVAARVVNDLDTAQTFLTEPLFIMMSVLAQYVGVMAIIFAISPQVGVVMLIGTAGMALLTVVQARFATRALERARDALGIVVSRFEEDFTARHEIRSFGALPRQTRAFVEAAWELRRARRWAATVASAFTGAIQAGGALTGAFVLYRSGNLVLAGTITVGTVLTVRTLSDSATQPLQVIGSQWTMLLNTAVSWNRIREPFRQPILPGERPGAAACPELDADIVFDHVSFSYPHTGREVLHDVSLRVGPGEVAALVGFTGAGKSSITKLLLRTYDPDSGAVRVDGVDLRDFELEGYRRRVSVVPQDDFVFRGTVASNIAYGEPGATAAEIEAAARAVGAHDVIAALPGGYDERVEEEGKNLTAAQRQLIALARAWITRPDILVLDEATASLDAALERTVLDAVGALGCTTLMVTHREHVAERADKVIVLSAGEVIEEGTPRQLIGSGGAFDRLWVSEEGLVAAGGRRRRRRVVASNGRAKVASNGGRRAGQRAKR